MAEASRRPLAAAARPSVAPAVVAEGAARAGRQAGPRPDFVSSPAPTSAQLRRGMKHCWKGSCRVHYLEYMQGVPSGRGPRFG